MRLALVDLIGLIEPGAAAACGAGGRSQTVGQIVIICHYP